VVAFFPFFYRGSRLLGLTPGVDPRKNEPRQLISPPPLPPLFPSPLFAITMNRETKAAIPGLNVENWADFFFFFLLSPPPPPVCEKEPDGRRFVSNQWAPPKSAAGILSPPPSFWDTPDLLRVPTIRGYIDYSLLPFLPLIRRRKG